MDSQSQIRKSIDLEISSSLLWSFGKYFMAGGQSKCKLKIYMIDKILKVISDFLDLNPYIRKNYSFYTNVISNSLFYR
jgi:hypothetical protein